MLGCPRSSCSDRPPERSAGFDRFRRAIQSGRGADSESRPGTSPYLTAPGTKRGSRYEVSSTKRKPSVTTAVPSTILAAIALAAATNGPGTVDAHQTNLFRTMLVVASVGDQGQDVVYAPHKDRVVVAERVPCVLTFSGGNDRCLVKCWFVFQKLGPGTAGQL